MIHTLYYTLDMNSINQTHSHTIPSPQTLNSLGIYESNQIQFKSPLSTIDTITDEDGCEWEVETEYVVLNGPFSDGLQDPLTISQIDIQSINTDTPLVSNGKHLFQGQRCHSLGTQMIFSRSKNEWNDG